jgi:hypothetical protein
MANRCDLERFRKYAAAHRTYFCEPVHPFGDLFTGKLVASVLTEMVTVLDNQVIHVPIVAASHVLHKLSHLRRV